jgi:hypothetical protein
MPSFNQDRLGTNKGESTPTKRCDFVLQEMGYKLFETFTLSTGSIKTVFSLATTVFLMPLWTAGALFILHTLMHTQSQLIISICLMCSICPSEQSAVLPSW